jgi:putative MATE family efflux protein
MQFAIPLFIGAFLQQGYQMADAIIVGRFIGPDALAAVSVSNLMATVLVIFLNGLAVGISTMTAQLFGAKKFTDIKNLTYSTILPLLVFSLILTVLFIASSRIFMTYVLNVPDNIIDNALSYYRIYMIGFIFLCIYNIFSYNLRAMGNSLVPLYFLALSSIISVLLDIVFIVGFGMGVEGAAIATVIAQFMAAAATVYYAFTRVPELNIIDGKAKFDKELFRGAMKYGIPNAMQQVLLGTSSIFLSRLINSFGYITIAANSAVERITSIATQFAHSLSRSLTSFTGQNIGAGKFDRITRGLVFITAIGSGIGLILTALCFLFPNEIIAMFLDTGTASAEQAIVQGVALLGFASSGYVFIFTNYAFVSVLRGAGDMTFTSSGTVIMVAFRIGLAYYLVFVGTGYVSISISLVVMNAVGSIVMFVRIKSGKWKQKAFRKTEIGVD